MFQSLEGGILSAVDWSQSQISVVYFLAFPTPREGSETDRMIIINPTNIHEASRVHYTETFQSSISYIIQVSNANFVPCVSSKWKVMLHKDC